MYGDRDRLPLVRRLHIDLARAHSAGCHCPVTSRVLSIPNETMT
jgi:hypothetical protein